ncbi:MAG TPA: hypothetical protein GX015_01545, partial [Corynebacterium sp.]|nr:hypothetical protein [Corynebacterium sp.]
ATVVDWTHLKVSGEDPQMVVVDDPFATADAEVDALVAHLESLGAPETNGPQSAEGAQE